MTRDALVRPASASWRKGSTTQPLASGIAYDNAGNLSSLTLGNGAVQDYVYDASGRLTSLVAPTATFTSSYDDAGNLLSLTDNATGTPRTFSYDPAGRLWGAQGVFGTFAWSYDPNGNRLSEEAGSTLTTYGYQGNRLSTVAGGMNRSYGYDGAGNPTGDGSRTFVYDGAGRLVKLYKSGVLSAEYTYDGRGRRAAKKAYTKVKNKTVTTTTVYHYDDRGKLIGETDGGGAFLVDYVHLEEQPLAQVRKSGSTEATFWYHNDHLGTPRGMSDAGQATVWRVEFDPFGNELPGGVKTVENNLRFPGQYFDAESGLHDNYFRDYDSKTGRYIEPETVGLKGGMNPFRFALDFLYKGSHSPAPDPGR